ncbi:hypothetical protein D477_016305 [Arthrobacter crystallopoietes BAB-32]|uniref:DUF4126 domain-containing protein n=1 Tax=Arthrobacter crystallopoietes BAB-32 TaxID=1246476 RepID=N1UZG5_9MICC|nr:DUF4126 domain-containing protein [Arthrobacter crystallopoietes]EMY33179.1 hypothetical protein D477_016305 [Arthrobacter crystallopoietes BAB-32]
MFEILTGTGLSAAAGLNAFIPMLILGLLDRYTDLVQLPPEWDWLANGWVLLIVGVLLVLEIAADKIPVVDSFNDWIQTVVRPAAGGIVFSSGVSSETVTVSDPDTFFGGTAWVPVVIGIGIAFVVHLVKMMTRPVLNAATVGAAAPVASTAEDTASLSLALAAVLLPLLVVVLLAVVVIALWLLYRRYRRPRRVRSSSGRVLRP